MATQDFAVVKINKAQYKISEGDVISVNRLAGEVGAKLNFNEVLLKVLSGKTSVGAPYVDKSEVSAEILEHTRGPKVSFLTYKAKSRQRRRGGHRQELTKLKINKIK